ncbi:pyridoxal-phosphate dependent enzyme [Variovorax sp. SRS16]|uniref:pyridoxal-phosphate dependent enzyme n=1 Tax=Variovorax sp. SRS16 TaxID=282217 RepID=UPI0013A5B8BB|nr:pyridoxal-phosphate dependent enzyme [Variovorax sp. SRS16]
MWRYEALLPVEGDSFVTLGEGSTPLTSAKRTGRAFGIQDLYVKDETQNPTQSYKDRLSTVAVSHAKQTGATVVATASSGNAGASLAAYAAKAGMACVVASMAGASGPMLTQIRKFGAHAVLMADKSLRWSYLKAATEQSGWYLTSPYTSPVVGSSPIGIEGYKTIAYEIYADLGKAPDWMAMPVCYGDALAGICQGFMDLLAAQRIHALPRFIAAEAHGSLSEALQKGGDIVEPVAASYETLAASVAATQSTYQALWSLRKTEGVAIRIGNEGLVAMQEQLASQEGIFLELASVMPFLAVQRLRIADLIKPTDSVICLATASGLKDTGRSTSAWSDLPVENGSVEQILVRTNAALRPTS